MVVVVVVVGVVVARVFVAASIVEFPVRVIPSYSYYCGSGGDVVVPVVPVSRGASGSFSSSYWYWYYR